MPILRQPEVAALTALASSLAGMYGAAELEIQKRIAAQVRRAFEAAGEDVTAAGVARQLQLSGLGAEASAIVQSLAAASAAQVGVVMAAASAAGATRALEELPDSLKRTTRAVPGNRAAQGIARDLISATGVIQRRLLRLPNDVFRRAVGIPTGTYLLGGYGSSREAQAAAFSKLIQEGANFTDAAGRRWNTASYVEMATRTAAVRARDEQHQQTLTDAGVDLFTIVVGSGACKACSKWSGQVVRKDGGPTGDVKVESVRTQGTVTVHVDGTIQQAESEGWHHPNCRCTTVAYLPGFPVVQDITTYDPQAEKDRARLRALERRVRAAKIELAAAVTPEQAQRASARVRAVQAQIRAHVSDTGLMRQTNREQIDLGMG